MSNIDEHLKNFREQTTTDKMEWQQVQNIMHTITKETHQYYNGTKILKMKDLDNEEPDIYLVTSNRSAGKTTFFLKFMLQQFKESKKKFGLLYRFSYELNASGSIFKDVLNMNPEFGLEIKSVPHAKGLFYELFLDDESFGYALSMSNVDALKKYSPVFVDIEYLLFDEFQSEKGQYLPKELEKFQSIYVTISRGGGSQSRKVKVFMLGNMVTIMNPYFIMFDIHKRLKSDTNFLRGSGWVAEFGFNESASKAIKSHGFFKAFSKESYMSYSTEKVYLYDSTIFIGKPKGRAKYLFTFVYDGAQYGVREYFDDGILYVSHKPDLSSKNVVAFKASDHNQNTMMLGRYDYLWKNIKIAFKKGYLRFDDMKSKNAIYDILAVDLYK